MIAYACICMYMYVYLCIYGVCMYMYVDACVCVCMCLYLFVFVCFCLLLFLVCLCFCLFLFAFVCLLVCLCVCLFVWLFACLLVCLCVCLCVCLFVCFLFVCLFVCLCLCVFVRVWCLIAENVWSVFRHTHSTTFIYYMSIYYNIQYTSSILKQPKPQRSSVWDGLRKINQVSTATWIFPDFGWSRYTPPCVHLCLWKIVSMQYKQTLVGMNQMVDSNGFCKNADESGKKWWPERSDLRRNSSAFLSLLPRSVLPAPSHTSAEDLSTSHV